MATDFMLTKYWEEALRILINEDFDMLNTVNTFIEPDLLNGNKSIVVQYIDDVTLSTYDGSNLTYTDTAYTEDTFTLDTKKSLSKQILMSNMNDEAKAKDVLNKLAYLASLELKSAINTSICAQYANVDSSNVIVADGSAVTLDSSNVFKQINRIAMEMEKAKIPPELGTIVIPSEVQALIKNHTNYKGFDGRVLYPLKVCNQISTTGSGTDKIWRIMGYHKWFITAGIGISEVEIGKFGSENFGHYIKALFYYATKVPTPLDGYGWSFSAKVDLTT